MSERLVLCYGSLTKDELLNGSEPWCDLLERASLQLDQRFIQGLTLVAFPIVVVLFLLFGWLRLPIRGHCPWDLSVPLLDVGSDEMIYPIQ